MHLVAVVECLCNQEASSISGEQKTEQVIEHSERTVMQKQLEVKLGMRRLMRSDPQTDRKRGAVSSNANPCHPGECTPF